MDINSWDENWNEFYDSSEGNKYPEEPVIRFVAKNFYSAKDRALIKILDLGCGTGNHIWYLLREGFSASGIDGSHAAIETAKKRMTLEGLKGDLHVGDFTTLPFEENSMNAIIDAAAIQHNEIPAIQQIVREMLRILKPGGKYYGKLIAEHKDLNEEQFSTHFFTKNELLDLFGEFKNLSIDEVSFTESNGQKSVKFWLVEGEAN